MTAAYRQKLLNWFCSLALLAVAMSASLIFAWFFDLPRWLYERQASEWDAIAWSMQNPMLNYIIYFPFLLFWHLSDFSEARVANSTLLQRFLSYRIFAWTIFIALLLNNLMSIGLWESNSCEKLQGALHLQCFVETSPWLMKPWTLMDLLAIILCIAKAVFSIYSLKKSKS